MSLAIDEKLGPYEIVALIGTGGMGEVYRATDTRLHREVAVKISAERFSDRFEREARAAAALNHPNVCTLHDVGPNYLVMELVEGPTLAERIREGPFPHSKKPSPSPVRSPMRLKPRMRGGSSPPRPQARQYKD